MNSTPRARRTKSRICYKEDTSIEESPSKFILARNRTKSKSCSPSRNNKTFHNVCSKENSFREGDSLTYINDQRKQFENTKYIPSVILCDLKNLQLENTHSVENKIPPTERRKSIRPKRKTAYLIEAEESQRLLKKNVYCEDSRLSDTNITLVEQNKPTALFSDEDIEGKQIFGFQHAKNKDAGFKKLLEKSKLAYMEVDEPLQSSTSTPRTSGRLNRKNVSTAQTPRTPRARRLTHPGNAKFSTPKSTGKKGKLQTSPNLDLQYSQITRRTLTGSNNQNIVATPRAIRNEMKKEIAKQIDADDVSDFSADESEYELSDEDLSTSSSEYASSNSETIEENSNEEDDKQYKNLDVNNKRDISKNLQKVFKNSQRKVGDTEYVLTSDNYFTMQNTKKNLTSNHTMDRLKNPQLTEEKLQDMMENISVSIEHTRAIENLNKEHLSLFDKWIYYMSERFNVLLYGIGSKRDIIDEFLKYSFRAIGIPCFVVNGYFPGLTVKDVLKSIMTDLLDLPNAPSDVCDAVDAIDSHLNSWNIEMALAVHNIDGPMLRNDKAQYVFSKLASLKNIYFIASIDHIRAPLFWGSSKLRSFNFSWWDVTTMKPYVEETVNENLSLAHKSGASALSSLKNVFLSLNVKARGIFFIIVKKQISGGKIPHYQGLAYQELYSLARESFLVSSDLALRTQLAEFVDHKLLKMKRTADGAEHLSIPIDNKSLQTFTEQQES